MSRIADHACNARCRDSRHCDLVYTSTTHPLATWRHLAEQYARVYGVRVVEMQPATEAPPLEAHARARLRSLAGEPEPAGDRARWLVWWEATDG